MMRFLALLALLLASPAHAQRPPNLSEGLTLSSPFVFSGAAAGQLLGVWPGAAAVTGVTIGGPTTLGVYLSTAGVLSATPPTLYWLAKAADASGIAGYYTATRSPSALAEQTTTAALTGTTLTTVASFITAPGDPGAIAYPAGNYQHYVYFAVDDASAAVTVTVRIFTRNAVTGAEAQIATATSATVTGQTVPAIVAIAGSKPGGVAISKTDRLIYRVYATRVSGPASIAFTLYTDGASRRSTGMSGVTGTGQRAPDYVVNVMDYGAVPDARSVPDGTMASGSPNLSSATANWGQQDVGKLIEVTRPSGAPLNTTIATVTDAHNVVLAANAPEDIGSTLFLGSIGASDASGGTTGVYVPGETVAVGTGGSGTTTGGTYTMQAVASVISTTVRPDTDTYQALTVAAGGSGGTSVYCALTGTSGTGTKFTALGTLSGGVLVSARLRSGGLYTVNPTLSGEAVTSDCGLTGATVNLNGMNVNSLGVSTAGTYSATPTEPFEDQIGTGAGSTSGATGLLVSPIWRATGRVVYYTDNNAALAAAINRAVAVAAAGSNTILRIPAGTYGITGAALPIITQPVLVKGDGRERTRLYVAEGYAGAHVLGLSPAFPSGIVVPSLGPSEMMSQNPRGAGVSGLTISGNSTATNVPDAIIVYDRASAVEIDDYSCYYLSSALRTGVLNTGKSAFLRESRIKDLKSYNCGTSTRAAIHLDSIGPSSGNNFLTFGDIDILYPPGVGLLLADHTTGSGRDPVRRIVLRRLRIERGGNQGGLVGDAVQIGTPDGTATIASVNIGYLLVSSPPVNTAAIGFYGSTRNTAPHDITVGNFQVSGASLGTGINVQAGSGIYFTSIDQLTARTTQLALGGHTDNIINTTAAGGSSTSSVVMAAGAAADNAYAGGVLVLTIPAAFTASISGTTMTVTGTPTGRIVVGAIVSASNITPTSVVTALGTGTGGAGTYTVVSSQPLGQTLGSRAMTSSFVEGRTITGYTASTKTVTIGALQGSASAFTYAPLSGEAVAVQSLVNQDLYFNGYGQEKTFTVSAGANSEPLTTRPMLLSGAASGTQVASTPINFAAGIAIGAGTVPSTASDACSAGGVAWDSSFVYLCTAANTWKRTAVTTWPGGGGGTVLVSTTYASSGTWTAHAGNLMSRAIVIGGGGCGGAGGHPNGGSAGSGGGSAAPGDIKVTPWMPAALLSSPQTITIGTTCTPAAGQASAGSGADGGVGGNATFGAITASGGGGGQGGRGTGANAGGGSGPSDTTAGVTNSSSNIAGTGTMFGGMGAGNAIAGNIYANVGGVGATFGAAGTSGGYGYFKHGGCGSGGGVSAAPAGFTGGAGGVNHWGASAKAGGAIASAGQNSDAPMSYEMGAPGASGGGGGANVDGGKGGDAGSYGGCGGGGGAAVGSVTSGGGGQGGAPVVIMQELVSG